MCQVFCKVCISARRSEAGLARNINRKNPNGQSVACLRLDQLAGVKAKATEHPGHILLTTYLHAVHPDSGKVIDPIEVQPHLPACIAFRKRDVPAKPSRLSSRAGFRKGIGIGIFVRPDIRIAINALAHQRARQRFHHGRRSPFAIIKIAAGKNSTVITDLSFADKGSVIIQDSGVGRDFAQWFGVKCAKEKPF
ncbi:MAG: hypothetical protein WCS94_03270 [Verrucomicrobiota bacterium]